jgi:hypothetical protein
MTTLAPLRPLLRAPQLQLPRVRPPHREGEHAARRCSSLEAEPVRPRDSAVVAVHLVWAARDVGGALFALAPHRPLLLALQPQPPHDRPPVREALPRDSLTAKPVRPRDPAIVAVRLVWEGWDVGGALAALAPLPPPPLALQLQPPRERPPVREALPRDSLTPSQSGHEIQPSSRYVRSGRPGMSEGRCPLLLHAYHPLLPFSSSPRASARPP